MQRTLKLALIAAVACLLGTATAVQSMAQSTHVVRPDPYSLYQDQPNSNYQGPGGYNSLADYTRSIEGIPCGMDCTQKAQQRMSR
ncbi:MAG: hypothetical protein ACLQIQ_02670 [Beijerinckiaceae bacterium]